MSKVAGHWPSRTRGKRPTRASSGYFLLHTPQEALLAAATGRLVTPAASLEELIRLREGRRKDGTRR